MSIGAAVSEIAGAIGAGSTIAGFEAAKEGFVQAGQIAYNNSQEALAAGRLQQIQTARKVYQTGGAGIAATAGNGLRLEGSAASILRNTAAQGAVAKQLIGTQTQIEVNGYLAQMAADASEARQAEASANAARASRTGGFIAGALDILSAGASGVNTLMAVP